MKKKMCARGRKFNNEIKASIRVVISLSHEGINRIRNSVSWVKFCGSEY